MENSQRPSHPKSIFPVVANNHYNSPIRRQQQNSSSYITSTAPLDEAMKELLDMCQQYTAELSIGHGQVGGGGQTNDDKNNQEHANIKKNDNTAKPHCDTNNHLNRLKSCPNNVSSNNNKNIDSIEKLQQKQTELQLQLDEVLQVAKELESRQMRKLNCILEEQDDQEVSQVISYQKSISNETYEDDGDDELIEFQKIENELRISELNRQLDHIQEELRLRLYKRLLSNTNRTRSEKQNLSASNQSDNRRGSYPDETSPSSSSCSDEASTSTTSNSYKATTTTTSQLPQAVSLSAGHKAQSSIVEAETSWSSKLEEEELERSHANKELPNEEQLENTLLNNEYLSDYSKNTDEPVSRETKTNKMAIGGATESTTNDYEVLTPTTSRDSVISSKRSISDDWPNFYGNTSNIMGTSHASPSPTCPSNNRNSSAYSDLERIEEDEEDVQDGYYGNSNHFRTIYEEKLSPIIFDRSMLTSNDKHHLEESSNDAGDYIRINTSFKNQPMQYNNLLKPTATTTTTTTKTRLTTSSHQDERLNNNSFCGDNFSSTPIAPSIAATILTTPPTTTSTTTPKTTAKSVSCTNRPLTLYLPKPNEEIDLVEHIQALGHDLNMISSDLRLDSTSAYGYLWKCCSNNSKKWLKRYFHFDRNLKALSYYDSRSDLVKKNCSPKNSVPFDAINDVYVDHKLSGIGEKDRSSKRHYVFVLATEGRKYLLASSRAETMRAWIDILFTAANANDYFQQQDHSDEADGDNHDHQDMAAYGYSTNEA